MENPQQIEKIQHLESKFSIASYDLIKSCEPLELKFYLWIKLWAINKHSAWPGYKTICRELSISSATLASLIKKTEGSGRLVIKRSLGGSNVYDITWYDKMANKITTLETKVGTLETKVVGTLETKDERIETKRIENNNKIDSEIFDFYLSTYKKDPSKYKLTPQRKIKINARLKEFSIEEIKKAISNASKDDFYSGKNDRGWKADFEYIFRSYEVMEKLRDLDPKGGYRCPSCKKIVPVPSKDKPLFVCPICGYEGNRPDVMEKLMAISNRESNGQ